MASISKISMLITANASKFSSPVKTATGTLQLFNSQVGKTKSKISRLQAVLIAVSAFLISRLIGSLVESNIQVLEFSKRIGASVQTIQGLQFAMTQTGHPVEVLNAALVTLAETMQEAKLGSNAAINTFKILGIGMADLANKSPTAVFTMIAEKISQIEDPARQAGIAFRIWGKDAAQLIPLLQKGADGIAEAQEKARRLGLIVDNDKLEKLKAGRIAISNLLSIVEGFALQLATQLAPYVLTLIQLLEQWVGKNLDLEKVMKNVGVAVGWFAQMSYNAFSIVKIMVLQAVLAWTVFRNTIEQSIIAMGVAARKVRDLADEIAGIHGIKNPQADRDAAAEILRLQQEKDAIRAEIAKMQANVANGIVANDVQKWFDDMNKKLAAGAARIKKENDAINEAFINNDLFGNGGKKMAENLLFPLEAFEEKMKKLKALVEKNNILPEEFGRAALKNVNDLQSALGETGVRLAGANIRGSVAAASASNAAIAEQQMRGGSDPAKRAEFLLRQANEQRKILVEQAKKTSDALSNIYEVKFPN